MRIGCETGLLETVSTSESGEKRVRNGSGSDTGLKRVQQVGKTCSRPVMDLKLEPRRVCPPDFSSEPAPLPTKTLARCPSHAHPNQPPLPPAPPLILISSPLNSPRLEFFSLKSHDSHRGPGCKNISHCRLAKPECSGGYHSHHDIYVIAG